MALVWSMKRQILVRIGITAGGYVLLDLSFCREMGGNLTKGRGEWSWGAGLKALSSFVESNMSCMFFLLFVCFLTMTMT